MKHVDFYNNFSRLGDSFSKRKLRLRSRQSSKRGNYITTYTELYLIRPPPSMSGGVIRSERDLKRVNKYQTR